MFGSGKTIRPNRYVLYIFLFFKLIYLFWLEANFFTILWWFCFITKIRQNLNNLKAERSFVLPEPRWEFLSHNSQLSALFTVFYEKAMATHSSVLAWRIPGMAEHGGLPSMGSQRVGHDWRDLTAAAWVIASLSWKSRLIRQ